MNSGGEDTGCAACRAPVPENARFCPNCGTPLSASAPSVPDLALHGEHRHITVMFCDLVGSTSLSHQLDPEDLRDLLRVYQSICATAIEQNGGMIARYIGDGVVAYFGFPHAAEDAAMRATEAALRIARGAEEKTKELRTRDGIEFATRIALHSGRVLISEMGAGYTREQHAMTGVVPNLAARIEQYAPRNGVVVSRDTRALIAGIFQLESTGRHELKGFREPVEIFRVLGKRSNTSLLPVREASLCGREKELDALRARWAQVEDGGSHRVALVAEPGTGKSALAAEFLRSVGISREQVVEFGGAIGDRANPFAALAKTIRRWVDGGVARFGAPPEAMIARWFGVDSLDESPHAQVVHRLWNGEVEQGEDGRMRLFKAGAALLDQMPQPLLIVMEDAHWLDPSSLDTIDRLTRSRPATLTLLLSRQDFEGHDLLPCETTIRLERLEQEDAQELIEEVAGAPVENSVISSIVDVSGGLPLFVEELTKALIEQHRIELRRGAFRPVDLDTEVATPVSLLDLISARLESLGDAKDLAQICAVLGRRFRREALIAVSRATETEVDEGMRRLVDAGIVERDWTGGHTFRHALFQKAAYESLVRSARRHWHGAFLDWLQSDERRMDGTTPDLLAFHLFSCERFDEAATRYLEAGQSANAASASREAAAHFEGALRALDRDGQTGGATRLQAQVMLAGALLTARGPGAPETRAAYDSALTLAEALPESDWHFPAYWGWWRVSETFAVMARRAILLTEISERMEGLEFKLQAKHCLWANAYQMGDLGTSIDAAEQGLDLYRDERFAEGATLYGGHDCKVCALGEIALARWLQGDGDAVLPTIEAALAHAELLDHPPSLLHALDISTMLHAFRRDRKAMRSEARRMRTLAERLDLEDYRAKADIFLGWATILSGQARSGFALVENGFETMRQVGTPEDFPVYQCARAMALLQLGDASRAGAALADGRSIIDEQGVNYWGAELSRQEAEIAMADAVPDAALIGRKLGEACEVATAQGARALELRAGLSRLKWARKCGSDIDGATAALREMRMRFPAGIVSRDLADADAALATMVAG